MKFTKQSYIRFWVGCIIVSSIAACNKDNDPKLIKTDNVHSDANHDKLYNTTNGRAPYVHKDSWDYVFHYKESGTGYILISSNTDWTVTASINNGSVTVNPSRGRGDGKISYSFMNVSESTSGTVSIRYKDANNRIQAEEIGFVIDFR